MAALYRYATHLCKGQSADAEDLLHDAVVRALPKRHQLRDRAAGRAWLFRIVTTTHLNRYRSRLRRAETFDGDLTESAFEEALAAWARTSAADELAILAADRATIQRCLDRLQPDLKAAVWLTDVEEFTQREVAEMLGIPEGTVASRVFRARRALRTYLLETDLAVTDKVGSPR